MSSISSSSSSSSSSFSGYPVTEEEFKMKSEMSTMFPLPSLYDSLPPIYQKLAKQLQLDGCIKEMIKEMNMCPNLKDKQACIRKFSPFSDKRFDLQSAEFKIQEALETELFKQATNKEQYPELYRQHEALKSESLDQDRAARERGECTTIGDRFEMQAD